MSVTPGTGKVITRTDSSLSKQAATSQASGQHAAASRIMFSRAIVPWEQRDEQYYSEIQCIAWWRILFVKSGMILTSQNNFR